MIFFTAENILPSKKIPFEKRKEENPLLKFWILRWGPLLSSSSLSEIVLFNLTSLSLALKSMRGGKRGKEGRTLRAVLRQLFCNYVFPLLHLSLSFLVFHPTKHLVRQTTWQWHKTDIRNARTLRRLRPITVIQSGYKPGSKWRRDSKRFLFPWRERKSERLFSSAAWWGGCDVSLPPDIR